MKTLDNIRDLPKYVNLFEVDGVLPDGGEADFLFITPTLKIHKYFIVVGKVIGHEEDSI